MIVCKEVDAAGNRMSNEWLGQELSPGGCFNCSCVETQTNQQHGGWVEEAGSTQEAHGGVCGDSGEG